MNPLLQKLKTYGTLSLEAEQELEKRITYFQKKKNDYFLKQGQVVSNYFLMEKGLIRAFFYKKDKEINGWFGAENEIFGSIFPVYGNLPSPENIQFLEDAEVYSIATKDLNEMYQLYPEFNLIGRKIAEELCMMLEERINSLHTDSALERYEELIFKQPYLLQRVNLGHIASYLGITQETLSRIRKK